MIIRFTPNADAELAEARQWYAHQRADLDIEFMENRHDREVVVRNVRSEPEVRRTGMSLEPCRSCGPLGVDLGLVPRPHGRGYYMSALRALCCTATP